MRDRTVCPRISSIERSAKSRPAIHPARGFTGPGLGLILGDLHGSSDDGRTRSWRGRREQGVVLAWKRGPSSPFASCGRSHPLHGGSASWRRRRPTTEPSARVTATRESVRHAIPVSVTTGGAILTASEIHPNGQPRMESKAARLGLEWRDRRDLRVPTRHPSLADEDVRDILLGARPRSRRRASEDSAPRRRMRRRSSEHLRKGCWLRISPRRDASPRMIVSAIAGGERHENQTGSTASATGRRLRPSARSVFVTRAEVRPRRALTGAAWPVSTGEGEQRSQDRSRDRGIGDPRSGHPR